MKLFPLVIGAMSALLGCLVITGWHLGATTLVQIHPTLVPMQYNTALGFVLCGIALVGLSLRHRLTSIVSAAIVSLIGLLTLLQYVLAVDFGIDQLLMEHYITVATSHPGRMAPNTATCFALSGTCVLLATLIRRPTRWPYMLGGVVAALGVVALSGYISHVPSSYGWGEWTRMAIHTSAGFIMLGAGLYSAAWLLGPTRAGTRGEGAFLPVSIGFPILVGAVCLREALVAHEVTGIRQLTLGKAQDVADFTRLRLQDHFEALERMGRRLELGQLDDRAIWEADAQNYVDHFAGIEAVYWVDESRVVRWVVPVENDEAPRTPPLAFEGRRADALVRARGGSTTAVSAVVDGQGGEGILVIVPLDVDGSPEGYLIGVFRSEQVLRCILEQVASEHTISVRDGNGLLFARGREADDTSRHVAAAARCSLAGLEWDFELTPAATVASSQHSGVERSILVVGAMFALTVSMFVYLLQAARRRLQQENVLHDLERHQAELDLANAALMTANSELEQFVYTASHDLKSPLLTIQGFVGFLRQDVAAGRVDRLGEFAEQIVDGTNRMRANIDDLLELSRVGRVCDQIQTIDPGILVSDVVAQMSCQLEAENVIVDVQEDIPNAPCDPGRLRQVLENLVANALKYGRPESGPFRITIGGERHGDELRLFVADNGPGVPSEYHQKIFGLFQRLETSVEGTGIGLAIVKRVAEVHGGRAWVEPTPGGGATFLIALPIVVPMNSSRQPA